MKNLWSSVLTAIFVITISAFHQRAEAATLTQNISVLDPASAISGAGIYLSKGDDLDAATFNFITPSLAPVDVTVQRLDVKLAFFGEAPRSSIWNSRNYRTDLSVTGFASDGAVVFQESEINFIVATHEEKWIEIFAAPIGLASISMSFTNLINLGQGCSICPAPYITLKTTPYVAPRVVPLPASLPTFAAGLLMMWGWRRAQK